MKKLKNCYYKEVEDGTLLEVIGQDHYFEIYDKDKNFVASVLSWYTVLTYNEYGVING